MMRRIIISFSALFALLAVLAIFSCEKAILSDDDNGVGDPDGNLHVTVTYIAKTPFDALTRSTPLASVITRMNYAVYDMDGTRVKQVNKTSDNATFNQCSFQLEPGTYQLVVVGHSSNGNPTMTDPTCIKFTNAQGFTDTFTAYEVVTVTEEQKNIEVQINRIVSRCSVVITDDFPANLKKMRFYYTGGSGAFDASTGLGCVNSKQDVKFDVTSDQKQFDLYTFLHDVEGTIHLQVTAHDADDNILAERTFDVPMERDHITWLTGSFFSGSGSSSSTTITVTVNTDWAGETHLTF